MGQEINNILQRIRMTAQTAAGNFTLPANAFIRDIIVLNTNGNAITGGLKFGTSSGGVDVVAALTVGGNALVWVTDALTLKRYFSSSSSQQIFFDAVTLWNSASVEIDVYYYQQ
jgi:hypothetical protein